MAYSDLTAQEKATVEQVERDKRAWVGQLQKLINDGKQLFLAHTQTVAPIMASGSVSGLEVIPSNSLPGSDPNWTWNDSQTIASWMDGSSTSLTGASGGDWDETGKLQLMVQAAGPLG